MPDGEYLDWVRKILMEKFGFELDEIKESSFFEDDLNMGEMELIELLEELDDELKVDLVSEKDNIDTVQDVIELLEEQIG